MPTATTREKPIILRDHEVRGILAGTLTEIRRPVKPQPELYGDRLKWCPPGAKYIPQIDEWAPVCIWDATKNPCETGAASIVEYCPFGAPGTVLWGRETWWSDRREPGVAVYDATPEWGKYRGQSEPIRSTHPDDTLTTREEARRAMLPKFWSKRSSVTMPRWASRITLEITGVRVERLQEISEAAALAEGIRQDILPACGDHPELVCYVTARDDGHAYPTAREAFSKSWDMINGKRPGCDWPSNPWLWVVSFRRLEGRAD